MKITLIKVLRDIKIFKGRTVLMLVGILIGIASVGTVLSAYSILNREMAKNFMDTNPASMVFTITNLDEQAVDIIKGVWPNTDIDIKKTVQARISRGDGTYGTIYLRAIQNFGKQTVDTFTLEKGSFPNGKSQMVLERDCLKILKNLTTGVGETVKIKLPGGDEKEIRISGIVHAPGLAPASMENCSYGFVTLDMLKSMGYKGWYDELRVVSLDNRMNLAVMREMAAKEKSLLTANGYTVNRVDVLVPGKHPHAGQLSSLLFLLQAFAVISLLAACLIIINLLNFIMTRQAKQIAIIKAVGGSNREITLPYFLYILIMSLGAILASIPISILAGCGFALILAEILNFNIKSYSVPVWVFIVQILTGILVPLLAAAWPIYKSCSISIKDGLAEKVTAIKQNNGEQHMKKISRSAGIVLPVRNLLRKKARTALAILALVVGGVLFMTAQNIVASINKTMNAAIDSFKWDYDIRLAGKYDKDSIDKVIGNISGLNKAEIWQGSTGFFKTESGVDSPNYQIKIAPPSTMMADLTGLDSEKDTIIITQTVADEEKWIAPHKAVTLQIGDVKAEVVVSENLTEFPPMAVVYISSSTYAKLYGSDSRQIVLASANTRDYLEQRSITKDIEAKFKAAGIELSENWNIYVRRKVFADHLKVIVTFLSILAMLAVAVGGLGIGSTIGINISERKYEIGVLRAIGANPRRIYALILAEVLLMGLASWLAGTLLSYPISIMVGNYFGQILLHANLNNTFSLSGSAIWLAISISVTLISGFIPARIAARSPLREMLVYE